MEHSLGALTIAERVLNVLVEVSQSPEVREDLELRLYDRHIIDSLQTVELILAFSEEFGVEISPAELDRSEWATPARIIEYLTARIGS